MLGPTGWDNVVLSSRPGTARKCTTARNKQRSGAKALPTALASGDVLLMMTDVVFEANLGGAATGPTGPDDMFGMERTLAIVRAHLGESPARIIEALHASVVAFCGGPCHADDMTVVVVKVE
jgi:serine phosphatase RsbU (regulator of sigma subunit)